MYFLKYPAVMFNELILQFIQYKLHFFVSNYVICN